MSLVALARRTAGNTVCNPCTEAEAVLARRTAGNSLQPLHLSV